MDKLFKSVAINVAETEPSEENSPLYTMNNIILTPHTGMERA